MGVRWLLRWRLPAGQTPSPQDEDVLTRMLDAFHCKAQRDQPGSKAGYSYEVKCQLLKQETVNVSGVKQTAGMKDVWLVQTSEAKQTGYLVHRAERMVLEVGSEGSDLMEKFNYKSRGKHTITLTGKKFSKGDFVIRLASATQVSEGSTATALGHVLEVEYTPLLCPEAAAQIGSEFLEVLAAFTPRGPDGRSLGSLDLMKQPISQYSGLPATYGFQHAAVQYVDMAIQLVHVAASAQGRAGSQQADGSAAQGGTSAAPTPR
mmetsp:Transcript_9872/g.24659  ORF Transcript_9872/g.24659 Transcript_9872/m.24659 type:complete len:262 (-) Transcript_9872:220-1005(-)|eukprot:CAMPEP_0202867116 /NCGR_PEP_ID=MMETSP1391-20130828/8741_1 /ASSEMBLY_ACC=CAM_ASM_000867 /TAXON_ID=1034604 /ORGANISM="Chlamydomonas leiostraca, Strain SAG 11-49" /LENGTH=261 /DNA_ID=CAMNT_0049547127 /DNA_START=140 /DNA_END=925 /DNA_ORIENTATION=-